jgi:hypothetical protein
MYSLLNKRIEERKAISSFPPFCVSIKDSPAGLEGERRPAPKFDGVCGSVVLGGKNYILPTVAIFLR